MPGYDPVTLPAFVPPDMSKPEPSAEPIASPAKARHITCTLEAYHQRPEFSHSQTEDAYPPNGSWPLFYGRHIKRIYPRQRTPALDAGSVAHQALTSPGGLDGIVAMIPSEVLNSQGHRKGKAWAEWSEEHVGKIQMTPGELEPIRQMVRNVYAHPDAAGVLAKALHYEFSLVYCHPATGLKLRARPDVVASHEGRVRLVDLKTTKALTPRAFFNDAVKYGYHRQAAWYWDALEQFGYAVADAINITVNKSPAHECRIYRFPPTAISLGRQENEERCSELARRLSVDDWSDPLGQTVLDGDLPRWAYDDSGGPIPVKIGGHTVIL